ncbi:MAG: SurA N-terminal domain-containing protein [Candidatus Omnitrophota bacterium]|nr:SurA N-terminal domain-containing protein [Candidatus Omnitrophota bacterium]
MGRPRTRKDRNMVMTVLRSRKFARRVLLALLILIIPAFVLWGVGNVSRKPDFIGRIGGNKIYFDDFEKSRQGIKIQTLFAYFGDVNTLNQILRNRPMINYMAWERLILLNASRDKNIKATNNDVIQYITQQPLFQRNGVFDNDVYNNILRNYLSVGPRQFEELVRENLLVKIFRDGLLKDIKVTNEETLEFYGKTNDKADLSFILIENDLFADKVEVSDAEAREYFRANSADFMEPAKVEVEYLEFPYESATDRDRVIAEIEKLYPQLREFPAKLMETADKYGKRYGRPQPFSREDVIPGIPFFRDFHETAFAMEEGEISPPVFSSPEKGSAYIIRKIKGIPPETKDLDQVRDNVKSSLAEKKRASLAMEKADELYKKITASGGTLEETALEFDRKITKTGPIAFNGYIENVGPAEKIVFRARETGEGGIIPPLSVQRGVFLARVDELIPADEAGYEKNKDLLHRNLLIHKQMETMEKWFKENRAGIGLNKPLERI